MCTVILRVPSVSGRPVRMLAVRDEDPSRPWQPLGAWWPPEATRDAAGVLAAWRAGIDGGRDTGAHSA